MSTGRETQKENNEEKGAQRRQSKTERKDVNSKEPKTNTTRTSAVITFITNVGN